MYLTSKYLNMKNLAFTILSLSVFLLNTSLLQAQNDERDGSKHNEKITVTVDGKKYELGDFISEKVEASMEEFAEGFEMDFDADEFDFSFNFNGEEMGEWGENLGKSIEKMVNNMDVELEDLDPEEFEDSNFDGDWGKRSGSDILDEIEDEYGSKVELIEKMKIKIREEKVTVDIDAKLEDGQRVHKRIVEERD